MELREYIRIILKSWWLILPITLLSLSVALFFSYRQTPIYQAESKYITVLSPSLSSAAGDNYDAFIYAFDTLTGRQRLFVTYCEIMKSGETIDRALQLLNIDRATTTIDLNEYKPACSNLPESNVLLLIVTGPNPELVANLNHALGLAGMESANERYSPFPLETLEQVYLNPDPISPSHSRDAILGGAIGVVISITIALVLEHLRSPLERLEALSIRDPLLNTFNDRYFQQRLTEEVNRARIRYRPLSMVYSRLVPNEDFALLPESIQDSLLRSASLYMQNLLREGDLMAYNRREDIFEILLPETPNHEAKELVTKLHTEIRNQTFRVDQYVSNFTMSSGVVEGSGETLELQTMIQQATKALEKARQNGDNTIVFMRGAPSPFVLDDAETSSGSAKAAEMNEYVEVPVPLISTGTPTGNGSETLKESRAKAVANAAPVNTGSAFVGSGWDDAEDNAFSQDYMSGWLGMGSSSGGTDINTMLADVRPMDDYDTEADKPKGDSRNDG
jgi:diguanylate cyclase (GGDEF)-like protein